MNKPGDLVIPRRTRLGTLYNDVTDDGSSLTGGVSAESCVICMVVSIKKIRIEHQTTTDFWALACLISTSGQMGLVWSDNWVRA